MTFSIRILLAAAVFLLPGCAMLPYNDSFQCPQMEDGRCVPVADAHSIAVNGPVGGQGSALENAQGKSDPKLDSAIENYRRAIAKGKPAEVEKRKAELLQIAAPGNREAFTEAVLAYKDAVKSGKEPEIKSAEQHLHLLHNLAVANANERAYQEADIRRDELRHEILGQYARGHKTSAVLTPPVIMETHILPYQTSSGTLAIERTLLIPVEDSTWIWPDNAGGKVRNEIGTTTRGR